MKRTWENATIETIEIATTAFGPSNPTVPDSDQTEVIDANGNLLGWKQTFGEPYASAK